MTDREKFHVGQYIIYVNGEHYELGRIKSLQDNGAFVAYHAGETGAKTPYDLMHPLVNAFVIEKTMIGGLYFEDNKEELVQAGLIYQDAHLPSAQPDLLDAKEKDNRKKTEGYICGDTGEACTDCVEKCIYKHSLAKSAKLYRKEGRK